MILHQNLEQKDKEDIIDMLADSSSIAIDVDKEEERNLTFAEKAADKISEIAGSWTFIFPINNFLNRMDDNQHIYFKR